MAASYHRCLSDLEIISVLEMEEGKLSRDDFYPTPKLPPSSSFSSFPPLHVSSKYSDIEEDKVLIWSYGAIHLALEW